MIRSALATGVLVSNPSLTESGAVVALMRTSANRPADRVLIFLSAADRAAEKLAGIAHGDIVAVVGTLRLRDAIDRNGNKYRGVRMALHDIIATPGSAAAQVEPVPDLALDEPARG